MKRKSVVFRHFLSCILAFLFIYFIYIQLKIYIFGSTKLHTFPGYHLRKRPTALYNSSTDITFELPTSPEFTPPLHTYGRLIVDSKNHRVKLKSINWYGASDINFIPMGLNIRHRNQIAALIRHMGFNSVRLPYGDELVMRNPVVDSALVSANHDLIGLHALDVYAAVVKA